VVAIDDETIARIRQLALASPQKRARLCLHPSLDESLHNMLIVLLRGTVVPMHRHPRKAECYHIVSGLLTLIIGDDSGHDQQRIPLGPFGSGRQCLCRIAAGLWHRVEVESDEVMMHESTVGPFDLAGTEYLPESAR
jgi:cupin fold WbuC family metalloprotein